MSEWKETTIGKLPSDAEIKQIGDCISLIIDHRGKTPKKLGSDWVENGIPAISAKNVHGGKLDNKDSIRYVTEDVYKKWMKQDVKKGDCFLVSEGATLGEFLYWDYDYPIVLSQRLFCIRTNPNLLYNRYFYAYMNTSNFQKQVKGRATGSSVDGLRQTEVLQLQIPIIPIERQKIIGDLLYNLERKQKELTRQNQTLEQLAQTLFKRWFVEFEFPCLPQNYRFSGHVNSNHNLESVLTYKKVGGLPVPEDKSWFVYVLLCEDNSFYKGMTTDLYRRFYEHYIGEGAKHTKTHKPIKVIHWEQFNSQKKARKREEELKTGYGRTWIKREYDKFLKYGHPQKGGLPAHQTRLIMAGKMVSSELGEIPEGWEVKPLSSIANYLNGLACQKFPVVDQKEKLPVLKIKELGNGIKDNVDWATSNVDSKYIINSGDIIFSWSGTLMLKIWDGETCVLNQHLFKVTSDLLPDWFIFQWTNYYLTHFIAVAKSKATTMGHIKRSHLDEALCFVPDKELLNEFDGAFKLSLESFKNNSKEIQTLTKLRDTLLPKLMSGELKVNPKNN